jgi:DNA-binding NarL/FixJ family response regulator
MKNPPESVIDPTQREILSNLAQGMTGPQVARAMAISEATMRRMLRTAWQQLGASSTTNAVYLAAKAGLI